MWEKLREDVKKTLKRKKTDNESCLATKRGRLVLQSSCDHHQYVHAQCQLTNVNKGRFKVKRLVTLWRAFQGQTDDSPLCEWPTNWSTTFCMAASTSGDVSSSWTTWISSVIIVSSCPSLSTRCRRISFFSTTLKMCKKIYKNIKLRRQLQFPSAVTDKKC